jgi:hypothetical protein
LVSKYYSLYRYRVSKISLSNPETSPPTAISVSTYQRKVFAFADDANMIIKFNYEKLFLIKTILADFGALSGLEFNVEKTTILPIGPNVPLDNRIKDLGFTIADEVTILGLKIGKGTGTVAENFTNTLSKIRNHITEWSRSRLSLPGRIVIAKTMLYSQIKYLGCFLDFPNDVLTEIDNVITQFVLGNLNVSKKRQYKPLCMGGLGLFNLKTFLCAQQATWVRKAMSLDEQWKLELYYINNGTLLNSKDQNISQHTHPTLKFIAKSYETFYSSFTKFNENFKKSFLFNNSVITRNPNSGE